MHYKPLFVKAFSLLEPLLTVGLVALMTYGVVTDCPNTAIYIYCSPDSF